MTISSFISKEQSETIHRNALRVLEESGVRVQHEPLARLLGRVGGKSTCSDRVTFSPRDVEKQIQDAEKKFINVKTIDVRAHVGIYECQFLDPQTGEVRKFDEQTLAQYTGFAKEFPDIQRISLLGLPFTPGSMSAVLQPLLEKLYAWKCGIQPDGAVNDTGNCGPLLEMFRCHASASGVPIENVFAASGYLISPLALARPQCEQLLWFADHGLEMSIGTMPSIAGSAPISLGGTLTLMLAEQLFLFLLRKAVFGSNHFALGVGVCSLDLRNGFPCYGRPEQYRVSLAMADMAHFYGCQCHGHAGLSDAQAPSVEAGAQKAMGLITSALAFGTISASAGLLSMDEICSPAQLVTDLDTVNSLNALFADPAIDDTECAVDEIIREGHDGSHLGTTFTAERCRADVFSPQTWSSGSAGAWSGLVPRVDADVAAELWMQHVRKFEYISSISADEEAALLEIITKS